MGVFVFELGGGAGGWKVGTLVCGVEGTDFGVVRGVGEVVSSLGLGDDVVANSRYTVYANHCPRQAMLIADGKPLGKV